MKTCLNQARNDRGSVLLVGMGITFVLGLGLASYLSLTSWENTSMVRSQAWNSAMAKAEAGVEEALAQLNPSALLFTTNINRGANGWSLGSDGMYHAPRRTLADGYYDVAMTTETFPTIYATGYVTIPTLTATVSRAVRATTTTGSIFRGAMVAIENIDLKGNGIATDSFDSLDSTYSTGGLYDPAKRKANGDVASTEGMINVQNADVRGTLYTSPSGSYSVGSQGTVGDLSWPLGGGLQPGHYKNDFNMDLPAVLAPYETALPPTPKTIGTNYYTWYLGYNNYIYSGGVKLQTGDIVRVEGRARVYVTGDFIMSGTASISIAPGASLELYVGGATTSITVMNNAGNCGSFSYYGLPGNTSVSVSGNYLVLGTIYAPSADLQLSGGGDPKLPIDFQGACSVRSIQMNGHFNYHFDENLKRSGPIRGYQITSWREI
jgi:hypothetical protein